ncbi:MULTISPECIES: ectoine/hydroxyectoine ABC transporter permease subunit EhuD [unclassified Mesorhizobium]|uniref:ectoine/hydroxyectoine ABC transporter permease subunit EhuD n=1 Tax=unclassified Mesorhizobium TaxID=325217 RepID=UPI000FCC1F83|nr:MULTISPECIES: ectoine/hydroxyectoine ABC transporter permease subunit EhuD [unclassified Mesorhizobium]RUU68237.1 ectoine/hydroxyectoine ABC transporter permease subunit EhuD [Mesorhizobium sp. M7A.T.Ca.TU.009.01.1.1]RUU90714.1 ectoine/hydroxyectoine ABC transporter permease subunit EhuD [Mesorhizobium sp. M7A.T.Ca.TU.009.01.1.2]RUX07938.1 ectoine/hydroxyectoine ABC transporter permease subunit EhuD [Mesorhizobium sp. M8A.F.Ca.ET.023.01.1.1]RVD59561.1 ectoine/hydroxyectoine ABC transporter p
MFKWDWDFTWQILPRLIHATGNTLIAALSGYAIAMVLGLALALVQRGNATVLRWLIRELIEFIRSTPLLVQVFFVFYVAPQFGVRLSPWVSGMLAIGLHYACYLSEVYRGGIEGVAHGQWEAATALNMSTKQTYVRIVIPQAIPLCIPGMGNYLVGIFKDTPMLSVIGVAELMHTANAIGTENYRFLEPYTSVGVIFLAISLPSAGLVNLLERYLRHRLGT